MRFVCFTNLLYFGLGNVNNNGFDSLEKDQIKKQEKHMKILF